MSRRTLAGLLALPLVVALIVCAFVLPLPYSILSPGETVNLLGSFQGFSINMQKSADGIIQRRYTFQTGLYDLCGRDLSVVQ